MDAPLRFPHGRPIGWLRLLASPLPALVLLPLAVGGRGLLLLAQRREAAERFSARVQRTWARATLRCFGVERRSHGRPERSVLVVSNHLSWLDVLVIGAELDCRFVAKSEIASWPVFGLLARCVGTVFVDRRVRRDAVRVAEEMERLLRAGVSVTLFPEGEVTTGERIERFHPALFEPAVRAGLGCAPLALSYATPESPFCARHAVGWWGGVGLVWHAARLGRFGRVQADCRWAPASLEAADRRSLASASEDEVRKHFAAPAARPVAPGDPRAAAVS